MSLQFALYYVELTTSQFHIFDGENGEMRKVSVPDCFRVELIMDLA